MKKKKNNKRKYLIPLGVCLLVVLGAVYYFFFASMSSSDETKYVYIDNDDTIDSVYTKVAEVAKASSMTGFKTLASHSKYADNIRTGRYGIRPGEGAFVVFRHLKNGLQTPVNLVVPSKSKIYVLYIPYII